MKRPMTPEEFNKECDGRAEQNFKRAYGISDANPDQRPTIIIQYLFKEIAGIQMILERLIEHTKLPKLDEKTK